MHIPGWLCWAADLLLADTWYKVHGNWGLGCIQGCLVGVTGKGRRGRAEGVALVVVDGQLAAYGWVVCFSLVLCLKLVFEPHFLALALEWLPSLRGCSTLDDPPFLAFGRTHLPHEERLLDALYHLGQALQ